MAKREAKKILRDQVRLPVTTVAQTREVLVNMDEAGTEIREAVKPVGRPSTVEGKRVQVYLDEASRARALELGDGNVSAGIRIALSK